MKILKEYCQNQIVVKNSRFIAEVFPVRDSKEAREKLLQMKKKYFDASHVVHAFVIGLKAEVTGMSDDGEPSGTAGRPVLDILKASGITNVIVTVTRYFGGTLLGTGGLVHAYSAACKELLEKCQCEEYIKKCSFSFCADYSTYANLKHFFENFHLSKIKEDYGNEIKCSGEIWDEEKENFSLQIKNFSKGKIQINFEEI